MILIDTPSVSCFNWSLISKEKFPEQYNDKNVEEDFDLLFQDHMDAIKLKEILRNSTREPNLAVRKFLWKRILLSDPSQTKITIEKYNKKINILFGKNLNLKAELPDFVDKDHLVYYYLNDAGIAAVGRILNVLASVHPDITFSPLLLPLASLFLHYMTEPECFTCLLSVVESKNKITETDIHWITTNHVFRRFSQKYAQHAYDYLLEHLYSNTSNAELCFEVIDSWQWWIFEHLPYNYVLNIVDSFLLEGTKVLYRFGIGILEHFYKYFLQVKQDSSLLKPRCIKEFCSKIDETLPFEKLIKTAFGFRNMSRKDIEHAFQAEEKSIKKMRSKGGGSSSNIYGTLNQEKILKNDTKTQNEYKKKIYTTVLNSLLKSPSIIEDSVNHNDSTLGQNQICCNPLVQNHNLTNGCDHQLPARSNSNSKLSSSWSAPLKNFRLNKKWYLLKSNNSNQSIFKHHHAPSNLNLPGFSVENIGSRILTPEQIATVWRWLPTRYQIIELQMIYSTNIHGCRLMTLFDKTEFYHATILVVQTTTGSIFGAFCAQPWAHRLLNTKSQLRPSFFGTGETFLFELKPNVEKYEWVGKRLHGETTPAQELFMYADKDKLIVGGGSDKGIGLLINSDLIYGRTSVSDTFENKILGTDVDFEISTLEVFSFNNVDSEQQAALKT